MSPCTTELKKVVCSSVTGHLKSEPPRARLLPCSKAAIMCPLRYLLLALSLAVAAWTLYFSQVQEDTAKQGSTRAIPAAAENEEPGQQLDGDAAHGTVRGPTGDDMKSCFMNEHSAYARCMALVLMHASLHAHAGTYIQAQVERGVHP